MDPGSVQRGKHCVRRRTDHRISSSEDFGIVTSSTAKKSVVSGLIEKRTNGSLVATGMEWAQVDTLRRTPPPRSLDDALIRLAIAERQIIGVLRENATLKSNSEHLMRALDATSRRAVAAERVAHHDGLTGLPNRLLLIKRLQLAIRKASSRHRQLALLFIDLDGFKIVNDRYGHTMADRLLSVVGARIATSVRAEDLACRYGGDEFVALLSDVDDAAVASIVAEKIRKHIGETYSIDCMEIQITASIGVAMYPADGEQYDALLNRADAAMYVDKSNQRSQCGM